MNETTRDFIQIAYAAMQKAYRSETKGLTECNTVTAMMVGDAMQKVGDLSRK